MSDCCTKFVLLRKIMLKSRSSFITLFVALASALILVIAPSVNAASSPVVVSIEPAALSVKPGDQSTIALIVDNVSDLYGVEVHLAFDPVIIEVVDVNTAKSGVQITARLGLLRLGVVQTLTTFSAPR